MEYVGKLLVFKTKYYKPNKMIQSVNNNRLYKSYTSR
jgi:hypothetical protein